MIPKNINKEHILLAIAKIKKDGIDPSRKSTFYDLIFEGERYPPKYIISIANKIVNGIELSPEKFHGGIGSDCFNILEKYGFKIIEKGTKSELFFINVLQNIKFKNIEFFYLMIDKLMEQLKVDENDARLVFSIRDDRLSFQIGHRYCLAVQNDSFMFIGPSTLSLNHLDVDEFKAKKDFRKMKLFSGASENDIISHFDEIYECCDIELNLKGDKFPKHDNAFFRKTIFNKEYRSDIFSQLTLCNIWFVCQGDSFTAEQGQQYIFAPKKQKNGRDGSYHWKNVSKVKKGDLIINYAGGIRGISIAKENAKESKHPHPDRWDTDGWITNIEYHALNSPITWKEFKNYSLSIEKLTNKIKGPIQNNGKVKQGYLFEFNFEGIKLIREEYGKPFPEKIERLLFTKATHDKYYLLGAYWDESEPTDQTERFIENGIWENGWDDKFIDEVNSAPINSNVAIKSVFRRGGKSVLKIKAIGKVIKNNQDGKKLFIKWQNDTKPFELDFTGGYWSTINEVSNKEHIRKIWSNKTKSMDQKKIYPTNTIYFGPPGTGKTYQLSKLFENYTDKSSIKDKAELIEELLSSKNYTWFDVVAAVLKMNGKSRVRDIKNHELVQAKIRISNNKAPSQTIWGQLQWHGSINCENINLSKRHDIQVFWKYNDSRWSLVEEDIDDLIEDSIQLINDFNNINTDKNNNGKSIKRYEFITFHQSFSYEDFIEGIKPVINTSSAKNVEYEISPGVFMRICNKARNNPNFKYALFIDEINRGNVASIFGELITLIEPDKREGMKHEMSATLPYSKSPFTVPRNLNIYGTMNTADRSIEALDSALRRRFNFIEIAPKTSLLKNKTIHGIKLTTLLNKINIRIEKLLDKDHMIGHSYFLNINNINDIKIVFKNNIIPLLEEYFFGDYGKIGLVLGESFFTNTEAKNENIFARFKEYDSTLFEEKEIYRLKDLSAMDDEVFIKCLNDLIK